MNLPDAEHLAAELERLQFARFGIAEAWEVATAFQQRVRADRLPVSLRIVLGEQIVVHLAAPGTSADTDSWLHRKVNTVRRFGTSTLAVLLTFEQRGPEFAARAGGTAISVRASGRSDRTNHAVTPTSTTWRLPSTVASPAPM